MTERMTGKYCVVTGAARGIGKAIAKAFVDEGATVLLTDCEAQTLMAAGKELGCETLVLDVQEESGWERLAALHPVADVVVNNAGVTGFEQGVVAHDPEHASLEDWRAVHRINLDGTFLGCRYAIKAMKDKGSGSIINGRDSRCRRLCLLEGGDSQPQQVGRALLCATGLANPLQLDPSRRNHDADVGADAGRGRGTRRVGSGAGQGHALAALWRGQRSGGNCGPAGIRRSDLYHWFGAEYRWRDSGGFGGRAGTGGLRSDQRRFTDSSALPSTCRSSIMAS